MIHSIKMVFEAVKDKPLSLDISYDPSRAPMNMDDIIESIAKGFANEVDYSIMVYDPYGLSYWVSPDRPVE